MERFTIAPYVVALLAGWLAMPALNVYKVCARNAGTLRFDPWRIRASAAIENVTQTIRAWFASLWSPRFAVACLALLLAVLIASLSAGHDGVLVAALPLATLKANRATLLRAAEALKRADGTFADDQARATFDAKMTEIDGIDAEIRDAEAGRSATLMERNPLDPGAPTGQRLGLATETPTEPNELDQAQDVERTRIRGIMDGCEAARIPVAIMKRLIDDRVPLVDAQRQILAELKRRGGDDISPRQTGAEHVLVQDNMIHVRAGIENAILHRVAPDKFKLSEQGRLYRGMTVLDIGRAYLQARGVRVTDMSKNQLAAEALGLTNRAGMHTTSDFSDLLADVANKTLRAAYEEQPQTWAPLARRQTLPDYKTARFLQFGDAPSLLEVKEHGEYKSGTIGEGKEQFALVKYGRKFAITREAIINDDLNAFSRLPMMFGRKARILESDLVWAQITSNPTMGDGNALFSAAHANLETDGDHIDVDSLGRARASLRVQTSLDGSYLNLSARYLLVPTTLETKADQFVTVITPQLAGNVNPFQGKLQVIAEPRLDANSATSWYIAASPDQIDIIVVAYLEGEEGPQVESRIGFDVDGVEIKCRLDFGTKVVDWRGLHKDPGDLNS